MIAVIFTYTQEPSQYAKFYTPLWSKLHANIRNFAENALKMRANWAAARFFLAAISLQQNPGGIYSHRFQ